MHNLFNARSVAIIGASDTPSNLGKGVINNLIEFGFEGSYFAVGSKPGTIYGKPIYQSVLEIPDEMDLALILVKAEDVPSVAEACGQKGIKRLVVSTAGFSEYLPEKKVLESRLLEICQRYGIRFLGPNCLAMVNMDNGLFLPFSPQLREDWQKGPVGVISQSGTLGMRAAGHLSYEKIGVSKVANIGNKLNVDEVDLIKYFLEDQETRIIFLYLEGLTRARELFEIASTATKPIIIHKSNISSMSHKVAQSHTNALASDEKVVEAAFKQAGIIQVHNIEEMLNCVKVLLLPPLQGNRLVCLSEAGGSAVVVADEAQRNNFTLSPLPQTFLGWLQSQGRAKVITLTNPLDLGDIFYNEDVFIQAFEKIRQLPETDGIFYDLTYSFGWDKHFAFKQKIFEYCNQVNTYSKIPVFVSIGIDTPKGEGNLMGKVTIPFFKSNTGAFKAMRQILYTRRESQ